jgi:hypothetical protein
MPAGLDRRIGDAATVGDGITQERDSIIALEQVHHAVRQFNPVSPRQRWDVDDDLILDKDTNRRSFKFLVAIGD